MRALTYSVLALILVSACGNTDRPLRDLRSASGGPDEFAVIPFEPLEIPATQTLPTPTPGGANRVDPTPRADAIGALGGSAAAQSAGGVPAGDAALVTQTSRYGVDPAIRATLAAEDAAVLERARRSNVFNPFGRDRYFPAYARQALDASAEQVRLRNLGVNVPNLPVAAPQNTQTGLAGLLGRRDTSENCQFTTIGSPDGRIRRVCTPVETATE